MSNGTGGPRRSAGGLLPLRPVLKYHDWGSTSVIPRLLGSPPDGRAVAELWIGGAPLPVLVKVLAVAAPLSLQLHPDTDSAARGFVAEQSALQAGRLRAEQRAFADPYGKPELLRAVTRFDSLSGLRHPTLVLDLLDRLGLAANPLLGPAVDALRRGDPRAALAAALSLAPGDARALAAGVVGALGRTESWSPRHTLATDLVRRVATRYPGDPALVATLLLEPFALEPGQTLWCPEGCPHVHVEGCGIEVQPSADTTLRAGLTGKRVHVDLFLACLGDRAAQVLSADAVGDEDVVTAPDSRLRLGLTGPRGSSLGPLTVPSVLLCLRGPVEVATADAALLLGGGDGAVLAAGVGPLRVARDGLVVRASTLGTTTDPVTDEGPR